MYAVQGAAPAQVANSSDLAELQSKIQTLENAIRSQRKTLRDQARALETLGTSTGIIFKLFSIHYDIILLTVDAGARPARSLPTDASSLLDSSSSGHIGLLRRNDSMREMSANANLTNMIEALTRQVNVLVENQKKQ